MIGEIRPKAAAAGPVRQFCICESCRASGPEVAAEKPRADEKPAEDAARAAGWGVHHEPVRTPVRKKFTGRYVVQYFCPKCRDKAGTCREFTKPRNPPNRSQA